MCLNKEILLRKPESMARAMMLLQPDQMFLHCVAQHIQLKNSLQPENKAKEISVCTTCSDQSLSADFLQVFLPRSHIRVLLVASS